MALTCRCRPQHQKQTLESGTSPSALSYGWPLRLAPKLLDRVARLSYASTMSTLHFICGKAASGKTTLARKLAARHRAALFCEDEWLVLLQAQIDNLADYVHHIKAAKSGFSTACDTIT
jgi:hypothetical protein